jgi:hypothetical protein
MTAKKTASKKADSNTVGRSDSEFMQLHDEEYIIPEKIKEGLKTLGKGWLYNQDFATLCGISTGALSAYRSQFKDHFVKLKDDKLAWFGNKERAEFWRQKLKGLVPNVTTTA